MTSLTLLLLAVLGPAHAGPWLPGDDPDGSDAIAEAPEDGAPAVVLDLGNVRSTLEDGVRRMIQGKADPVQALVLPVAPVPETTAAELRGLLAGSGAQVARLDALRMRWIFYKGESAVLEAQAVVRPDAQTSLLRLTVVQAPATPTAPPITLPGGLGVSWSKAEATLSRAIREGRCDALPLASDTLIASLVPAPFVETTTQNRNGAGPARGALCAAAAAAPWDRLELHLTELHFNLFDKGGAMRGGLELRVAPDVAPAELSFPMFKRLPEGP